MKTGEQFVVQRYLPKPYLIDGLKFDMRIYVLVYGVDPLRLFVFREGLARFATHKYVAPCKGNLDNLYMHLTNYSINRNAANFKVDADCEDDDQGHKRTVTSVLKHIENDKNVSVARMWEMIDDICLKTLIAALPSL